MSFSTTGLLTLGLLVLLSAFVSLAVATTAALPRRRRLGWLTAYWLLGVIGVWLMAWGGNA